MAAPQPFTPEFVPGLFTEQTDRGATSRWKDGDKVRWKNALPQTIGGWVKRTLSATIKGKVRRIHEWQSQDSQKWIAIGTNSKLYVLNQGTLYDITPLRRTVTLTNPFTTTNGSASVLVTDVGHDASLNDFVRFSGATAVGGLTINGEYQITQVISGSQYRITAASAASSGATGGGIVAAEYDINNGGEDTGLWYGWGTCTWGSGFWGTPRQGCSTMVRPLRTWSLDNWGEDLLASPIGGAVYYWDRTLGPLSRAVLVEGAPTTNQRILVSPTNRQLIALGAHNGSNPDPLLIRVSNNEDFTDFVIDPLGESPSNAFEKRIDSGSAIISGLRTRNGILISTDLGIHLMQPDPDQIYDVRQIGEGNGFIGPNAAVDVDGTVYYMAPNKFMMYDGVLQEIPCEVWTKVFGRETGQGINIAQANKVYCFHNDAFGEIWWLYPQASSSECDRYVMYSIKDRHWSYGSMDRTAGNISGPSYGKNKPVAISSAGYFYTHEDGDSDHNGTVAIPLYAYLESYDLQLPDINGNPIHVGAITPDDKYRSGDIRITLKTKKYPKTTSYTVKGPYVISNTATIKDCRARGRQMAILFESGYSVTTCRWRMGAYTFEVSEDGGER